MKVLEPFQLEVYQRFPFGCLNIKASPKFPTTKPIILEVFVFLFQIFLHFFLGGGLGSSLFHLKKKTSKAAPKRHIFCFSGPKAS